MPLRVVYRRALRNGEVHVNPCTMIDLPAVRGRPTGARAGRRPN